MRLTFDGCAIDYHENYNKVVYITPIVEAALSDIIIEDLLKRFREKPFYAAVFIVQDPEFLTYLQKVFGLKNNILWKKDAAQPYDDLCRLIDNFGNLPVFDDAYGNKVISMSGNFNPVGDIIPIGITNGLNICVQPDTDYPKLCVLNKYWDVVASYAEEVPDSVTIDVAGPLLSQGNVVFYDKSYVRRYDDFGPYIVNPHNGALTVTKYPSKRRPASLTYNIDGVCNIGAGFKPMNLGGFTLDRNFVDKVHYFTFAYRGEMYIYTDNFIEKLAIKPNQAGVKVIRTVLGYKGDTFITDLYRNKRR